MNVAILIPAYNPDRELFTLIQDLSAEIEKIIVVDDGSGPESRLIFDQIGSFCQVTVLHHAINLGKGAAIKTGASYFLSNLPNYDAIVTVDADGQHLASDALAIAREMERNPDSLVLGVRLFDARVPRKRYVGNMITRWVSKVFFRLDVSDTQTGLRGIPRAIVPLILKIPFNRYEFEMEMLVKCQRVRVPIIERPIKTIYIAKRASSHFDPIRDSMRVYFVLFRYVLASFSTAMIDYTIFFASLNVTGDILSSTYAARLVALIYNYSVVYKLVFRSRESMRRTFPLYLTLVAVSGFISATIIEHLSRYMNIFLAKVVSELLLYLANFLLQKEIVFKEEEE